MRLHYDPLASYRPEDQRARAAAACEYVPEAKPLLHPFELEAGCECGLGDLDLLRRRLRGREAMLKLVAGLGESAREAVLGIAHHPAEDLGRCGKRHELRAEPRGPAEVEGCARREHVADRGGREQGADQVRPAAAVLLRRALALLVRADRD